MHSGWGAQTGPDATLIDASCGKMTWWITDMLLQIAQAKLFQYASYGVIDSP